MVNDQTHNFNILNFALQLITIRVQLWFVRVKVTWFFFFKYPRLESFWFCFEYFAAQPVSLGQKRRSRCSGSSWRQLASLLPGRITRHLLKRSRNPWLSCAGLSKSKINLFLHLNVTSNDLILLYQPLLLWFSGCICLYWVGEVKYRTTQ